MLAGNGRDLCGVPGEEGLISCGQVLHHYQTTTAVYQHSYGKKNGLVMCVGLRDDSVHYYAPIPRAKWGKKYMICEISK